MNQRRNLGWIHDVFLHQAARNRYAYLNRDELSVCLLSGPEPALFKRYGFYGALFLAVAEEPLRLFHGNHDTSDYLLSVYNQLHQKSRTHPERQAILTGYSELSARHTYYREQDGIIENI